VHRAEIKEIIRVVTDVVGSHGEFKVVLGVLAPGVLKVQKHSCVVDQNRKLLLSRSEILHELPHRLQIRKIQLYMHTNKRTVILQDKLHLGHVNLYIVEKYFQCATIPSLTVRVYLRSFSRCSLPDLPASAKF